VGTRGKRFGAAGEGTSGSSAFSQRRQCGRSHGRIAKLLAVSNKSGDLRRESTPAGRGSVGLLRRATVPLKQAPAPPAERR